MKTILVRTTGNQTSLKPLLNGEIFLPFIGVTCYTPAHVAEAREFLRDELQKRGLNISDFVDVNAR